MSSGEIRTVREGMNPSDLGNQASNLLRAEVYLARDDNERNLPQGGDIVTDKRAMREIAFGKAKVNLAAEIKELRAIDLDKQAGNNKNYEKISKNGEKIENIIQWFHDLSLNQGRPSSEIYEKLRNVQITHETYRFFARASDNAPFLRQYAEHSERELQASREILQAEVKNQTEEIKKINRSLKKLNQKEVNLREALRASLREKRAEITDHIRTYHGDEIEGYPNYTSQVLDSRIAELKELTEGGKRAVSNIVEYVRKAIDVHPAHKLGALPHFDMKPTSDIQDKHKVGTKEEYVRNLGKPAKEFQLFEKAFLPAEEAFASSQATINSIEGLYKSANKYDQLKDKIQEKFSLSDDKRLVEYHTENLKSIEDAEEKFNQGAKHYRDAVNAYKERASFTDGLINYDIDSMEKHQYYTRMIDMSDIQQFDSLISDSKIDPELTTQLDSVKEAISRRQNLLDYKKDLLRQKEDLLK